VFLDNLGNYFTVHFNGADGGLIIFAHKAAVTFDIGTEDCCELTFKVLSGHGPSLFFGSLALWL
jgi:hypothetical protein